MSWKKYYTHSLFKDSSIYASANFLNAIIPFILLPILTKKLTPFDYGLVSMYSFIQALVTPFIGLNLNAPIQRKFFDEEHIGHYIGNSLIILFIASLIYFTFVFCFSNIFYKIVELPIYYYFSIGIVVSFSSIANILLTILQVKKKSIKYASIQVGTSLVNFLSTILFVIVLNMTWEGRIFSIILTSVIIGLLSLFYLYFCGLINLKLDKRIIIYLLKFGGGLIPHTLGGIFITMTGRYYISKLVNLDETGLYSLAFSVTSVLSFITLAFNNSFSPWLFEKLKVNDLKSKDKIVKITYIYFITITILGLGYYFCLPLLFKYFIGENFVRSIDYCLFLMFGFIFQGMYFMVANYVIFSEKTIYQAIITIFVGILNVPTTYFLIKFYGGIGASISFSITFFILFIFTWILSNMLIRMPWKISFKQY